MRFSPVVLPFTVKDIYRHSNHISPFYRIDYFDSFLLVKLSEPQLGIRICFHFAETVSLRREWLAAVQHLANLVFRCTSFFSPQFGMRRYQLPVTSLIWVGPWVRR